MKKQKYKQLSEVCTYGKKRYSTKTDHNLDYVSTENMLPNRGGVKPTIISSQDITSSLSYSPQNILISNIRLYFKKIWYATNSGVCSNDVLVLDVNEGTHPIFLYYALSDSNFFNYADVTSKGTKMPRGSKNAIMKYLVPDIDYKSQINIANVLSAYDSLIENNNQRISLLEKVAMELYKEWFIRYRFPNYDAVKITNGVPEGWEIQRVGKICDAIGGGTPSTSKPEYYLNGTISWVTPTDITNNDSLILLDSEIKITKEGLKKSSAKLLPPETILMTSRASIGYFAICEKEVCTNQGFIACIPHNANMRMYLLFNLISRKIEIEQKANGATYLEMNKSTFKKLKILVPDSKVLEEYEKRVYPILQEIRVLEKRNHNLTKQRDLLLPRLLSGKLEVK